MVDVWKDARSRITILQNMDRVSNKVDLYIATITLKVLGSVAAGDYTNVLSLAVDEMINTGNFLYVQSQPGQVNDRRGGAQSLTRASDAAF